MKSLKDFNYLLSLDRRYTKTESEIFRLRKGLFMVFFFLLLNVQIWGDTEHFVNETPPNPL